MKPENADPTETTPNADGFWDEREIDELAMQQDVQPFALPADYESDPWRDEDEARALIEAIRSS